LTPTPFLNLVVLAYLDTNSNGKFDLGEGIEGLRVLVQAGVGGTVFEGITQRGEWRLALPTDLANGAVLSVQAPYLHFAKELTYKPGQLFTVEIALKQPDLPVLMP
jgi:hypothetical protein